MPVAMFRQESMPSLVVGTVPDGQLALVHVPPPGPVCCVVPAVPEGLAKSTIRIGPSSGEGFGGANDHVRSRPARFRFSCCPFGAAMLLAGMSVNDGMMRTPACGEATGY